MIPNTRFAELLKDIEPSTTTKTNASSAHTGIRKHLQSHESFKDRWINDFLAGSYARDTAIRPKKSGDEQDRPDVDIIVVTNFSDDDHPNAVLREVRKALEDGYEVERVNKRSVRVNTSQAEMDIVPLIEAGDEYLIPDRDTGGWIATNPPIHTQWSSEQNSIFGGRFKQLVKLLKWWRRENPSGKRPKGFVLEVLVSLHAPKDETHYGEAFTIALENIHTAYSGMALLDQKPVIEDPAIAGNDILSKVTVAQWKNFLEKVRVHGDYARRAQDEEDMDEATRLWRKVFGSRFKNTVTAALASSYGSFAAAEASPNVYKFPNEMAAPNKPRGFA